MNATEYLSKQAKLEIKHAAEKYRDESIFARGFHYVNGQVSTGNDDDAKLLSLPPDAEYLSKIPIDPGDHAEIQTYVGESDNVTLQIAVNYENSFGNRLSNAFTGAALADYVHALEIKPRRLSVFACNATHDNNGVVAAEFLDALVDDPRFDALRSPVVAFYNYPVFKQELNGRSLFKAKRNAELFLKTELPPSAQVKLKRYYAFDSATGKYQRAARSKYTDKKINGAASAATKVPEIILERISAVTGNDYEKVKICRLRGGFSGTVVHVDENFAYVAQLGAGQRPGPDSKGLARDGGLIVVKIKRSSHVAVDGAEVGEDLAIEACAGTVLKAAVAPGPELNWRVDGPQRSASEDADANSLDPPIEDEIARVLKTTSFHICENMGVGFVGDVVATTKDSVFLCQRLPPTSKYSIFEIPAFRFAPGVGAPEKEGIPPIGRLFRTLVEDGNTRIERFEPYLEMPGVTSDVAAVLLRLDRLKDAMRQQDFLEQDRDWLRRHPGEELPDEAGRRYGVGAAEKNGDDPDLDDDLYLPDDLP
jgi:hypothetical protein